MTDIPPPTNGITTARVRVTHGVPYIQFIYEMTPIHRLNLLFGCPPKTEVIQVGC